MSGFYLYQIGDGTKAAQTLLISSPVWTSVVPVQAYQRVNVGFRVGNTVSDILSEIAYSTSISAITSAFSGVLTLQRRMREEDQDYHWRDVAEWSVLASDGEDASLEAITELPEPEPCEYRLGLKSGDYISGVAIARLGTS